MLRKNSSRETQNVTNPGLSWAAITFFPFTRQGIMHKLKHLLTEQKKTDTDFKTLTQPFYNASNTPKTQCQNLAIIAMNYCND
eukprot:6631766-Ditylum_brightwellii.AAC.1